MSLIHLQNRRKQTKKILKNSNIFFKKILLLFYFLFSVFAFMLLKPSRYWERISQTTQKGGHASTSLPFSANLTKQKPVHNTSQKIYQYGDAMETMWRQYRHFCSVKVSHITYVIFLNQAVNQQLAMVWHLPLCDFHRSKNRTHRT